MRMNAAILATMLVCSAVPAEAKASARADAAALPIAEQNLARYASLYEVPEVDRPAVLAALSFIVPCTSSAVLLEDQLPVQVPGTLLYRLNLGRLKWDAAQFAKVAERSPYNRGLENPLIVRADWIIWELSDGQRSQAYYELLYGAKPPQTRDEFFAFWQVNQAAQKDISFGLIEGQSGVNKEEEGARWIERIRGQRVDNWHTRDVFEVKAGKDPLNAPTGNFQHDAEEHFFLIPKYSRQGRGILPATFLANGQGKRVEVAPVAHLEDTTRVANSPEIRNPVSCFSCHIHGPQRPQKNAIAELLRSESELYALDEQDEQFIESFHLGGIDRELDRWAEDFTVIVKACNGLTPEQNAVNYRLVLAGYQADVSLDRAALEQGATAEDLSLAIAYAAANNVDVGVRLTELARGVRMTRSAWEADFEKAGAMVDVWRSK